MIKINLRGVVKRNNATNVLQIGGYVLSVAVLGLSCFILYMNTTASLSEKSLERDSLQLQLDRLKTVTKEVRDLEAKKTQLAERLAVIATLKKNKIGPVKVLDDLNLAMPDKIWLTTIQEIGGPKFTITGMGLDNQTIATFMKELEASDYFSNVELIETKQKVWQGVSIKEFTLQSTITYAGQIVPIEPVVSTEGVKS